MRIVKSTIALLLVILMTACPGSKDDGPDVDEMGDPGSVTLVFPDNNSECTEGATVNDVQSAITFQWQASENADSYEVNVKNLDNGETQKTESNSNESTITLNSNTPYEWFVITKSNDSESAPESAKWKFYNAGVGVVNYAPFPAEAFYPKRGGTISANTSVALEWKGDDVDNDITEFEVFFGTEANPSVSIGSTIENTMTANVISGETYYWQVKTEDKTGNTSISEIFNFKVE
ncbi:hypothetical protein [Zobellia laminariae]|uniref:hypothetical protein n=1 Tax=Zobellia laminariae TaxID=248906 RepID=UPI0026F4395E|nr:hypothetical protein [Zobellia laminariae]WKX76310.1 hypothetical protein Q5W13_22630 [Zobellia laminariae]